DRMKNALIDGPKGTTIQFSRSKDENDVYVNYGAQEMPDRKRRNLTEIDKKPIILCEIDKKPIILHEIDNQVNQISSQKETSQVTLNQKACQVSEKNSQVTLNQKACQVSDELLIVSKYCFYENR
ncbi:28541_t:CDS:2, partial [Dentiscutata erythropus]